MRILYIAKHCSGGNNDEDAVSHVLRQLGCDVIRLNETNGHTASSFEDIDLALFHKWSDTVSLSQLKCLKAFWYFDLVQYPDPLIQARCVNRMYWMKETIPYVDIGFCTDGDWAARHPSKLHWLPQGADERVIGSVKCDQAIDVLFTGTRKGGQERESFVDLLSSHYGSRFKHVSGYVHGPDLAKLIGSAKVVVAPDAPVTNRYCSNRVYLSLGFGAFMMHPICAQLDDHYGRDELVQYRSRSALLSAIDYYLPQEKERRHAGQLALARTKRDHLYRHRCERLLNIVTDKLGVK